MSESAAITARRVRYAAAPLALIASSAFVWHASNSAFKAETSDGTNSWSSGTVALTDDGAPASAMFDVSGLRPGDTGTKCIAVTYEGTLAAAVKLYGTATGGLAQYLDLTVELGTGGGSGGCGSFAYESTVYTGTLQHFGATAEDYASGVGDWTILNPPQTKTYKFTYSVRNNNDAQGISADATFTWEAQNT